MPKGRSIQTLAKPLYKELDFVNDLLKTLDDAQDFDTGIKELEAIRDERLADIRALLDPEVGEKPPAKTRVARKPRTAPANIPTQAAYPEDDNNE